MGRSVAFYGLMKAEWLTFLHWGEDPVVMLRLTMPDRLLRSGVTDSGELKVFMWTPSDDNVIEIPIPGSISSRSKDINDHGQIVGGYNTSDGEGHSFIWDSTYGVTDLPCPEGLRCDPAALNNNGQIVGVGAPDGWWTGSCIDHMTGYMLQVEEVLCPCHAMDCHFSSTNTRSTNRCDYR